MSTNFPTSLDNETVPAGSETLGGSTPPHRQVHENLKDAVQALEAKVGADSSAVVSSLDYKVANGVVLKSLVDAKGDLLVGTANDTVARKAAGANDRLLIADSSQADGLRWATPAEIRTALALATGATTPAKPDTWVSGKWHHPGFVTSGSYVPIATLLYLQPRFFPYAHTIDRLGVSVASGGAAGATCRLGIWANAAGVTPGAVLAQTPSITTDATGLRDAALGSPLAVAAGTLLWLGSAWFGAVTQPTGWTAYADPDIPIPLTSGASPAAAQWAAVADATLASGPFSLTEFAAPAPLVAVHLSA